VCLTCLTVATRRSRCNIALGIYHGAAVMTLECFGLKSFEDFDVGEYVNVADFISEGCYVRRCCVYCLLYRNLCCGFNLTLFSFL
jgi:hypothetical protein